MSKRLDQGIVRRGKANETERRGAGEATQENGRERSREETQKV